MIVTLILKLANPLWDDLIIRQGRLGPKIVSSLKKNFHLKDNLWAFRATCNLSLSYIWVLELHFKNRVSWLMLWTDFWRTDPEKRWQLLERYKGRRNKSMRWPIYFLCFHFHSSYSWIHWSNHSIFFSSLIFPMMCPLPRLHLSLPEDPATPPLKGILISPKSLTSYTF